MKQLTTLLLAILSPVILTAQLFNDAVITIQDEAFVTVEGNYTNMDDGLIDLEGEIWVAGNWYNNAAISDIILKMSGLTILNGDTTQLITGLTETEFSNLILFNSFFNTRKFNYYLPNVNTIINGYLDFQLGCIHTTDSTLVVVTDAPNYNAILNYDIDKFIVGNLRRYVNQGGGYYPLPVGTWDDDVNNPGTNKLYYELGEWRLLQKDPGFEYIDVKFTHEVLNAPAPSEPFPNNKYIYVPIGKNDSARIDEFLNNGYWTINSNNDIYGIWDLRSYARGQNNTGSTPEVHALVWRDSVVTAWDTKFSLVPHNPAWQFFTVDGGVSVLRKRAFKGWGDVIVGKWDIGLPIELLNFNARCHNNLVQIEWTTASEINNDYFTIEKSSNGITWQIVAIVDGAGNSNQPVDYSIADYEAGLGISYYRLKQTDYDGAYEYFNDFITPVSCTNEPEFETKIYADENNYIYVDYFSYSGTQSIIRIFDAQGTLIFSDTDKATDGLNRLKFHISSASGIYMVTFTNKYENKTEKILLRSGR